MSIVQIEFRINNYRQAYCSMFGDRRKLRYKMIKSPKYKISDGYIKKLKWERQIMRRLRW